MTCRQAYNLRVYSDLGFKSQSCYILAIWTWANHLNVMAHIIITWEIEIIAPNCIFIALHLIVGSRREIPKACKQIKISSIIKQVFRCDKEDCELHVLNIFQCSRSSCLSLRARDHVLTWSTRLRGGTWNRCKVFVSTKCPQQVP